MPVTGVGVRVSSSAPSPSRRFPRLAVDGRGVGRAVGPARIALGAQTGRKWRSGSASPCQGEGRGFESRLPLHLPPSRVPRRRSQVVRQGSAKPPSPVRIRSSPPPAPLPTPHFPHGRPAPPGPSGPAGGLAWRSWPLAMPAVGYAGPWRCWPLAMLASAGMAELADAADLKSAGRKAVWVRSPLPAPPPTPRLLPPRPRGARRVRSAIRGGGHRRRGNLFARRGKARGR